MMLFSFLRELCEIGCETAQTQRPLFIEKIFEVDFFHQISYEIYVISFIFND